MMDEIESGNVSVCLCKDVSRLGRDYLRVGLCIETMRENRVRLIAVNDGLDTINGEDDFTPFRNILHKFYARDTSRKLKSSVTIYLRVKTRQPAALYTDLLPKLQ
jgi:DNA invertase Pin-like site-specific DNA recombinase